MEYVTRFISGRFYPLAAKSLTEGLTVAICYILLQPDILSKLRQELQSAIPDPNSIPSWNTLENLPYLISTFSPFST